MSLIIRSFGFELGAIKGHSEALGQSKADQIIDASSIRCRDRLHAGGAF